MNEIESNKMKVVYTAQSKKFYFAKMLISKFTFENGAVPLNPFNVFGYFLYDLVDRELVKKGNKNIIRIADEIWVFGSIADGVLFEIEYGMQLNKPIKFFTAGSQSDAIHQITDLHELHFEDKVLKNRKKEDIIIMIQKYISNEH